MPPFNEAPPISPSPNPSSAGGAEALPETPGQGGGLSQEDMRANLQDLMGKIQERFQDLKLQSASAENMSKEHQGQALREVFNILESLGVDPSSPEAVAAFLEDLRSKNPELAQQVESALESILGEEDVPEGEGLEVDPEASPLEGPDASQVNMNIDPNEVPPENV